MASSTDDLVVQDGWDDDVDDLLSTNDDNNDNDGDDAWSFDDDSLLTENNNQSRSSSHHQPTTPSSEKQNDTTTTQHSNDNDNNWSFHDDDLLNTPKQQSPMKNETKNTPDDLTRQLTAYVKSLPLVLSSMNALLEAEYNTPEHAAELLQYYQERPQLQAYTLETELPRMDYVVVLDDDVTVLTEKQDVLRHLSDDSIVVRCANQSLLPDVLAVLTGHDLMIQPQYMATTKATSCRFTIYAEKSVNCACELAILLPNAHGEPYPVARLHVAIDFNVVTPSLQYRLQDVELVELEPTSLQGTAQFLNEFAMHHDNQLPASPPRQEKASVDFRDAFVLELWDAPKQFVKGTSTGLTAALKQVDAVANVSNKVNFLTSSSLLPTAEQLHHVADMTTMTTNNNHVETTMDSTGIDTEPATSNNAEAMNRPKPILGGLLMSGLTRLAKHVTLPEEEEGLYNNVQQQQPQQESSAAFPKLYRSQEAPPPPPAARERAAAPKLYRKDQPPPPPSRESAATVPKLYRKDPPPPPSKDDSSASAIPKLYRKDPPPPPPPRSGETAPKLYRKDPPSARPPPPPPPPPRRSKRDHNRPPPPTPPRSGNSRYRGPSSPNASIPPTKKQQQPTGAELRKAIELENISTEPYNPDDDIIPTRKRWVNPRFRTTTTTSLQ